MLYYDLINEKDGVDYGEGKYMVRTTKNNVNVVTFTTLLRKILNETNTSAMGVFLQNMLTRQQRIIKSSNNKNN